MALEGLVQSALEMNNLVLFVVLILLFVVAYRVLQAVINTALIAVLSGVFLVVMDMAGLGPTANFNNIMLFAVLGTGFFVLYSALATVIRASSSVAGALSTIGGWLVSPFRGGDGKEQSEKDIILEEMKEDD